MATTYSDSDKATSFGVSTDSDCSREITLGMTRSAASVLDDLSEKMDAPVDEVMTQAVGLLMVAVRAQERGLRICFADDDLNIVTEVVNFGIDGLSEDESGRLDP